MDKFEKLISVDFSSNTTDEEWQNAPLLLVAHADFFAGELDMGAYQDILEYCGLEPNLYLEEIENAVGINL